MPILTWKKPRRCSIGRQRVAAANNANPKDYVDTRFIDERDRSGFIDALYRQ